jgi:hypothetical protein
MRITLDSDCSILFGREDFINNLLWVNELILSFGFAFYGAVVLLFHPNVAQTTPFVRTLSRIEVPLYGLIDCFALNVLRQIREEHLSIHCAVGSTMGIWWKLS